MCTVTRLTEGIGDAGWSKRGWLLTPLTLASFGGVCAAEIDADVSLAVIRTDNLTQTSVDPIEQTVYLLRPTFTLTQESPRVDAQAAYRLDGYRYQQLEDSEVYNLLDAMVTYDIVPDRFFLNAGGSRTHSIRAPEDPIPLDSFVVAGNLVERDEYYAGPSFAVPMGPNVAIAGDLRRTWVNYGDPDLGGLYGVDTDTAELTLDNYRRARGLAWALRYDYTFTDYGEGFAPFEYHEAALELGFWAGERTRLFVVGGRESPWDQPFQPSPTDKFWELGFATSGRRIRAEVTTGERSYGESERAELTYDFGRVVMTLLYAEIPSTTGMDQYDRGGLIEPEEPPDYLFRLGAFERYIDEQLVWTAALDLPRTALTLWYFDEVRRERALVDGTPLPDEAQEGAEFTASWQIGARTELVMTAQKSTRGMLDVDDLELTAASLAANRALGPRTELSLTFRSWKERPEDPNVLGGYRAKVVYLSGTREF